MGPACPPKVMKTPLVRQPLIMEASPSPLSSRAQPRDLQFRGPFLEMFFDSALEWKDLRFSPSRIRLAFAAVVEFVLLQRFRNWCGPKPKTFSWFSSKENHSSRSL